MPSKTPKPAVKRPAQYRNLVRKGMPASTAKKIAGPKKKG